MESSEWALLGDHTLNSLGTGPGDPERLVRPRVRAGAAHEYESGAGFGAVSPADGAT